MYQAASIGEELEVFERDSKFHFKVKDSEPPILRSLNVDHNIRIQLQDGRRFSLISGIPGLLIEEDQEKVEFSPFEPPPDTFRVRDVILPGVCFKVLS